MAEAVPDGYLRARRSHRPRRGAQRHTQIGGRVALRVHLAARHQDLVRSLVLIGFSTQRLSRADLRQVNVMIGTVRASRLPGPARTALLRRVTEQITQDMFGTTFMSDPARADDRELWRQRFMALLVSGAAPVIRKVFGHPGTSPELLAQIKAPP